MRLLRGWRRPAGSGTRERVFTVLLHTFILDYVVTQIDGAYRWTAVRNHRYG